MEAGVSIVAVSLPSLWPLFHGGGSLESIMKLARSVTSLASRSSLCSAENSNEANTSDSNGIQLDELAETVAPDVPQQAELPILRKDSVQVSCNDEYEQAGARPEDDWR